jgi:hypothetical protein
LIGYDVKGSRFEASLYSLESAGRGNVIFHSGGPANRQGMQITERVSHKWWIWPLFADQISAKSNNNIVKLDGDGLRNNPQSIQTEVLAMDK